MGQNSPFCNYTSYHLLIYMHCMNWYNVWTIRVAARWRCVALYCCLSNSIVWWANRPSQRGRVWCHGYMTLCSAAASEECSSNQVVTQHSNCAVLNFFAHHPNHNSNHIAAWQLHVIWNYIVHDAVLWPHLCICMTILWVCTICQCYVTAQANPYSHDTRHFLFVKGLVRQTSYSQTLGHIIHTATATTYMYVYIRHCPHMYYCVLCNSCKITVREPQLIMTR